MFCVQVQKESGDPVIVECTQLHSITHIMLTLKLLTFFHKEKEKEYKQHLQEILKHLEGYGIAFDGQGTFSEMLNELEMTYEYI